jgi:hypothetical protein
MFFFIDQKKFNSKIKRSNGLTCNLLLLDYNNILLLDYRRCILNKEDYYFEIEFFQVFFYLKFFEFRN